MRLKAFLALTLTGAVTSAWASDNASTSSAKPGFAPTLQAGLTFGGDTLATSHFTNGDSEDVDAGALVYVGGGLDYRAANNVVGKLTLNYFVDNTSADNGRVRFQRFPLELTIGREFSRHRIAGGFTRHFSPKLTISSPNLNGTLTYDDANGVLVEYGYRLGVKSWLTLRYVNIDYRVDGYRGSDDGSHVGIGVMGSF